MFGLNSAAPISAVERMVKVGVHALAIFWGLLASEALFPTQQLVLGGGRESRLTQVNLMSDEQWLPWSRSEKTEKRL